MHPEFVDLPTALILAFQVLLGLVAFFGGWVLKDMKTQIRDVNSAISELREDDKKLVERLGDYTHRDDFREFREEQRESFNRLFQKMDKIGEDLAKKADR